MVCKSKKQKWAMKKYQNAEERLSDELDWVSIIKSIRELKVFATLILDQQQRQLLAFSKYNIVTDEPNTKRDSEFLENWVPTYNSAKKNSKITSLSFKLVGYNQRLFQFMKLWESIEVDGWKVPRYLFIMLSAILFIGKWPTSTTSYWRKCWTESQVRHLKPRKQQRICQLWI